MRVQNLRLLALAVFSFAVTCVRGLELIDSSLASACIYYEKTFDWGCHSHGNGAAAYRCRCGNVNWLGTITNCIANNTKSLRLRNHGFRHVARRCYEKGDFNYTLADMQRFYANGTGYLRDPTTADLSSPVFTTLRVNQTEFDWYYKKMKDLTFSVQRSQWFGWGLVFFWATIIAVTTLFNFNEKFVGLKLTDNWLARSLMIPSLFENMTQRYPRLRAISPGPHPNRLQALVVTAFVIQTIITVGVGYEMKLPHPYLTTRWFMNLDLVSYRVDLMALSLFPVIYFFGIRNNPFIPLTGMSYTTFSYFHKWCAYVCVVLAFIHSIIWTVYARHDGGYKMWAMDSYWQYGIAAMTLMALLVFHSFKLLRDKIYEVFLFFHQMMNIFFIVCMYYHLNKLGWLGWVWSMAGILCFDRAARIVRIILSGGLQKSTLTDCGSGVIKLTVMNPRFLTYRPGSYAFIYFMSPQDPWYYPWQSHPFTVLSTAKGKGIHGNEMAVYFKAQKGVTGHMLYKLLRSGEESINIRVMVEGPYGDTLPQIAKVNRRIVGVAAGLGVTAVYAQILHLLEAQVPEMGCKLYWAVNDLSHVSWFEEELKWLLSQKCQITILCTSPKELEETGSSFNTDNKLLEILDVRSLFARPDLRALVSEEVKEASDQSKDLTFISCGPSTFNIDFRASVSNTLRQKQSIDVALKEESFVW
ncbi:ferric/cupric-chelate reductase [Lachancea thermotolerans CBS 6340]|uniref:KLTH0H01936p n=1 Tax=Lachancea thermotolerans (strain ATCC 56472 / CBS 6340 / NRRL Y-8284) TaxID=559295 RepID=C5E240_LACTC|nr:KLTH0H01936p [Lachancea thermotolerans CBS 6340]CAR30101.1 KLTH0H01936p [Lachancea thermotolerans CBS 6340]